LPLDAKDKLVPLKAKDKLRTLKDEDELRLFHTLGTSRRWLTI